MVSQYEKQQKEWIKLVDLKDGDLVKVIVEPGSTAWDVDTVPFKVGTLLVANCSKQAHDNAGLSVYRPGEPIDHSVKGVPFFCVIKVK